MIPIEQGELADQNQHWQLRANLQAAFLIYCLDIT